VEDFSSREKAPLKSKDNFSRKNGMRLAPSTIQSRSRHMINKVGSNADLSALEHKQATTTTENVWEKYARDLEELKTNPPRKFAVTISQYRAYQNVEFPAWKIPLLIDKGKMSAENTPALYDVRVIMTEPYLKMLRNGVGESYLRDIVEIDPETGQPLSSQNIGTALINAAPRTTTPVTTASSSAKATVLTETTARTRAQQVQGTASVAARQKTASVEPKTRTNQLNSLPAEEPFDFTKLSPELQETTLQLAEQLLSAALRRLRDSHQLEADVLSLLDQIV